MIKVILVHCLLFIWSCISLIVGAYAGVGLFKVSSGDAQFFVITSVIAHLFVFLPYLYIVYYIIETGISKKVIRYLLLLISSVLGGVIPSFLIMITHGTINFLNPASLHFEYLFATDGLIFVIGYIVITSLIRPPFNGKNKGAV
ncbi:hypothetical protein [Paenibacillus chibensis]|uniref:hypothetical protein n=1 Tax=Paenibacillus chibensis TaxID=59846 RepID=UPI000FD7F337|nr:hypothetical protein [Paenibacillus chibensis]MEC0373704.1 hypothetical protein [Paenibacillus chibensis]